MKTSLDVYNRINWDTEFNQEDYVIGYRNLTSIVEMKFSAWIPALEGGDIPWHRVMYFKNKDREVLWHKEQRIDAIFHTGDNPSYIDDGPVLKSFANVVLRQWSYDGAQWTASMPYSIDSHVENFRILSWNIMSHQFRPDLDHDERYMNVCHNLRDGNYDIMCLQEVTAEFLGVLKEQEWAQNYWMSDATGGTFDNSRDIEHNIPMGIVTLSRLPCKEIYMLCDTKNSLVTEFLICGYNVNVVNVHLTSNTHGDASERRRVMMQRIGKITNSDISSIWVVTGDFNAKKQQVTKIAPWLKQYESAYEGATFCPSSNPLAKTKHEIPDRQIDHMFITPDLNWHLLDNSLVGTELPVSDHYGICTKLELYNGMNSGDTCMVLTPPIKYWPLLIGPGWIEKSCLPGDFSRLKRWVPHVSVILGYYEPDSDQFDLAVIEETFKRHAPFTVKFNKTGGYQGSPVLTCSEVSSLKSLERDLRKLCPTATRQLHDGEYSPHITLLIPASPGTNLAWDVHSMYIDVKSGDQFKHHSMVGRIPPINVDEFVQALRDLFPMLIFQVIGSRLYLDDTASDLDMIAYGVELGQEEFYDRVVWVGQNCGYFEHVYITDSKIRIVKMFNPDIGHVDLQYIQCSEGEFDSCPSRWTVKYNQLQLVDRSRILVLQDNIHYNNILTETQKNIIRSVKNWAKRRCIYLNCVGYLSGIIVTVMTVYSKAKTVEDFFKFYQTFDFSSHTISEKGFKPRRKGPIDSLMYVSSPIHPFNLNVKVTRSSIRWITTELNEWESNYNRPQRTLEELKAIGPWTVIPVKELATTRLECIEEYGRLIGRLVNVIVLLEITYKVNTHVVETDSGTEDHCIYMFLHKFKDVPQIGSAEMCSTIRAWFKHNKFMMRLKFNRAQGP